MATRDSLQEWVLEALRALGGRAHIVPICKIIWQRHSKEIEASGDLLYTWQYDMRWAGQKLRDEGILKAVKGEKGKPWELVGKN